MQILDTESDVRELSVTEYRCEVCGHKEDIASRSDYPMHPTTRADCSDCGVRRWFNRIHGAPTYLVDA